MELETELETELEMDSETVTGAEEIASPVTPSNMFPTWSAAS
jgi:hypothetical protein